MVEEKEEAKANLAYGTSFPFTSFISFLEHKCFLMQNKNSWNIDTGATNHMCMPHVDLSNRKRMAMPILVKLATNQSTKAYHTKKIALNDEIKLNDVLQFELVDVNLIFVAKLTQDLSCSDIFYHNYHLI